MLVLTFIPRLVVQEIQPTHFSSISLAMCVGIMLACASAELTGPRVGSHAWRLRLVMLVAESAAAISSDGETSQCAEAGRP
jgi:hypothetical protein